jgi:hypothetical protein
MRHLPIFVSVLLNVLFCVALLWLFTHYSYLRPNAGSTIREMMAALLLLITLYANYFLLYPKIHSNHFILYWVLVLVVSLVTACADLAIAYPTIVKCNSFIITEIGWLRFFSALLFLIFGRNVALQFFPFMLRERQQLQEIMYARSKIVYQEKQLIDVADKKHVMHLLPKDRIYYCKQDGNYTRFYDTRGNSWYTRLGSMKYHQQLLGEEDFVRISPSLLLPYQYIVACNGNDVLMKRLSWMEDPLVLSIEYKDGDAISNRITRHLLAAKETGNGKETDQVRKKRKSIMPSQDKKDAVLHYIKEHSGCRSSDISAQTHFSSSTVERSISELKKQGLIRHTGSKKQGGYYVVES